MENPEIQKDSSPVEKEPWKFANAIKAMKSRFNRAEKCTSELTNELKELSQKSVKEKTNGDNEKRGKEEKKGVGGEKLDARDQISM